MFREVLGIVGSEQDAIWVGEWCMAFWLFSLVQRCHQLLHIYENLKIEKKSHFKYFLLLGIHKSVCVCLFL